MTFFPEPLKPSEGRKDDYLTVNAIEADKKNRESPDRNLSESNESSAMYGAFLELARQWIQTLTTPSIMSSSVDYQNDLYTSLHNLQKLFNTLKDSDLSRSPQFAQSLSKDWLTLINAINIHSRTHQLDSPSVRTIQSFKDAIAQYPAGIDQKLGFYLERSTGSRWLPQPFIHILHQLHTEHRHSPKYSTLQKWSDLITNILQG